MPAHLQAFDTDGMRSNLLGLVQSGQRALRAHRQFHIERIIGRQAMRAAKCLNQSEHLLRLYRVDCRAQRAQGTEKGLSLFWRDSSALLSYQQRIQDLGRPERRHQGLFSRVDAIEHV